MPLIETKGAASAQGFGEFAKTGEAVYIESCFSTWLYTGNNSTQTITNGIDLSTKGGMVWIKDRSATWSHEIFDTARGNNKGLYTNSTSAEVTENDFGNFLSNGFSLDGGGVNNGINISGNNIASWTFRKQPKFFDVVTYTGDGNYSTDTPAPYGRAISHALGSTPGFIVIKATSTTSEWYVAARQDATYWRGSLGSGTDAFALNRTNSGILYDWATKPMGNATSFFPAQIGAGGSSGTTNDNGVTYVAYLFAHDAGGFGLTGADNVISCGSYTGNSGAQSISLGYEPQWLLVKNASSTADWVMYDNMRGIGAPSQAPQRLFPNTSGSESAGTFIGINATGFMLDNAGSQTNASGNTYIYVAIRRGPMKTPTTGTSVYEGTTRNGTGAAASISGLAFPPDAVLTRNRDSNSSSRYAWYDKLRGPTIYLDTAATDAEFTVAQSLTSFNQTGESFGTGVISNANGEPYINWQFRRAPGFFDVVCYTGTGTNTTQAHNLGVVPEMMIVKRRNDVENWYVYHSALGATKRLKLNLTDAEQTALFPWNNTAPTASVFSLANSVTGNGAGDTYIWYGFATVAGVSKVGSYTGTGALQTINCGFTGGARFVLIKRTDSTGDWYVWDSARGIVSGNDPYLLLNTSGAEVQGTDYVDTYSAGFEISSTAPAAINANGGTFIFLAIA